MQNINIKELFKRFISLLRDGLSKLKEVYKLPYFKTYLFLSIIMIIVFTVFTFPYEHIVRQNLQKLEKKSIQSIFIQDIDISLIGKSYFDNIFITLKGGNEVSIKQVEADLALNPYSLLFSNTIKGDLQASGIRYTSQQMSIDVNLGCNIDITLNAKTSVPSDGTVKILAENIMIKSENVTLPPSMGGFSLPPSIRISSINIDGELNNNKLTLKQCLVSGSDIRGTITGSIILAPITGNSKLDIIISLDPESGLLAEYKPLLSSFVDGKGKISIPLKGTFSRPRADMKGGTADFKEEIPEKRDDPLNLNLGLPEQD